ncbi:hypothetical protein L1987_02818 [Smallanthus sonchifolius]|uniref:Uncharacterized protein n=1 Tax=Smallanthus sonchifolius TaxID=185202 RepID=A0ACB9K8Z7_9ASTR|nr:hypothetical protein L1987_02818 [Smallanthus sonchifolius]
MCWKAHYERLPITVRPEIYDAGDGGRGAVVDAEAYYAHRKNQGGALLLEVQGEKRIIPVSSLHDNPNDRIKWMPIYHEDNECIGKVQLSITSTDETTHLKMYSDEDDNEPFGKQGSSLHTRTHYSEDVSEKEHLETEDMQVEDPTSKMAIVMKQISFYGLLFCCFSISRLYNEYLKPGFIVSLIVHTTEEEMIYRKWSLLTGPAVLFSGIAGAVVVVDFIFRKQPQDQLTKTPMNKQELMHAAK